MANNRYILFCGDNYYPAGTNDIKGCFPTMKEALDAWRQRQEITESDDWAEIYDVDTHSVSRLKP